MDASAGGRICSFCNGSKDGPPLSDFNFGIPITLGSIGFPLLVFSFLIDRMSFDEIPRLPGDGGPYTMEAYNLELLVSVYLPGIRLISNLYHMLLKNLYLMSSKDHLILQQQLK